MCTACVVLVKRLRRTENVRGIFEGVSAPRECGQPSPLPAHRNPYGSRHSPSHRGPHSKPKPLSFFVNYARYYRAFLLPFAYFPPYFCLSVPKNAYFFLRMCDFCCTFVHSNTSDYVTPQ
jgi:hypothetical protein